ncbi:MAG: patatin-like phospholipase family protein, partial [Proteobacteria bacterium]|nr:patatin-like phospholipase family protein [Pseudomonadota bacterium]
MSNGQPISDERITTPVALIDTGSVHKEIEPGIALCLSGGGYRAMVFHVGALWRLNELGYLPKLVRISSVSGGSITAALLGLNWSKLDFNSQDIGQDFVRQVVKPIRGLAGKTIDRGSIIGGLLTPGSIADKVAKAYRKHLFDKHTLQHIPDKPRFVINATNVQSGALWRFMKPYMRDYRVGEVRRPDIELAVAVAASSAFPPFLSPVELELNEADFTDNTGTDLQHAPFTTDVILTDGGVYDNLGLETAFKRYETILTSDAGGKMPPEEEPKTDWARHSFRVLSVIDNQVRSLRKRQLIASYINNERKGAYWGIRTNIAKYNLADALEAPHEKTIELANIATRLKRLKSRHHEQLINWGYAVCD